MKFAISLVFWTFATGVIGGPVLYRRSPMDQPAAGTSSSTSSGYNIGSVIYAKPKDWGQTGKNAKTDHPAIVIGKGTDASGNEQLHIAPMSHNHPRNPHQISSDVFHPHTPGQTNGGGIALQSHTITPKAHNVIHPTYPAMPREKVNTLRGYIHDPSAVPEHLHHKSSDSMRTRWEMEAAVAGTPPPTHSTSHTPAHGAPHGAEHESSTHGHAHGTTPASSSSHGHGHDAALAHGHDAAHGHGHDATHGHGHDATHGHGHDATHGHGHDHASTTTGHGTSGHGHTTAGAAHGHGTGPYAAAYAARSQRGGRSSGSVGTHGSTHTNSGHSVGGKHS